MDAKVFLLISVSLCLAVVSGFAQAPQLINYQGNLNQNGSPANGTFSMTFSIYDSETDGNQLWSETQSVAVANGSFNVLLGSVTAFPGNLFTAGGDRYLEIQVGNDVITPRFRWTSVAYALRAAYADTAEFTRVVAAGAGNSLDAADGDPTDVVFVNNDGNVGIGTVSPDNKLEVFHPASEVPIRVISLDVESFGNSVNAQASYYFRARDLDSNSNPVPFIIRGDGNVGIGTASPNEKLAIEDADGPALLLRRDGFNEWFFAVPSGSDRLGFRTGSNTSAQERVTFSVGGNVGIGNTNPRAKLDVIGGIRSQKGSPTDDSGNVGYSFDGDGDTGMFAEGGSEFTGSDIVFRSDSFAKLRITADGRVGIGKSDPFGQVACCR